MFTLYVGAGENFYPLSVSTKFKNGLRNLPEIPLRIDIQFLFI